VVGERGGVAFPAKSFVQVLPPSVDLKIDKITAVGSEMTPAVAEMKK
jgi:hypothetical protein